MRLPYFLSFFRPWRLCVKLSFGSGNFVKIFAGTSGYSYKEWKGKFYPAKISPQEMLGF